MDQVSASFDIASSARILDAACRRAGLRATGARLLRHHTNAVYRLDEYPVIVKISRPGAPVHRVVQTIALAQYLSDAGVPVIRPWPDLEQPITVDGCHSSFWVAIDTVRPARAEDLAGPLHLLHDIRPPGGIELPALDPFAAIATSLARPNILTPDERAFLIAHSSELKADYATLHFAQTPTVIHGDAHHSNTLVGRTGPVLADLESACLGPTEWDLITVAVHCRRFGYPVDEYQGFTAAYGRDVDLWPGSPTLTSVRELRMITTNAWKSRTDSAAATEVHRRIRALREGDGDRQWRLL